MRRYRVSWSAGLFDDRRKDITACCGYAARICAGEIPAFYNGKGAKVEVIGTGEVLGLLTLEAAREHAPCWRSRQSGDAPIPAKPSILRRAGDVLVTVLQALAAGL